MSSYPLDKIIESYVIQLNNREELAHQLNYNRKFYRVDNGRKYAKVVQYTQSSPVGGGSAYCFISRKTGDVFKASSWSSPAKNARYSLTTMQDARELAARSDSFGEFLYARNCKNK